MSSYQIAAVKFSLVRETTLLFVCTSCGAVRVEAPSVSKSRHKVAARLAVALGLTIAAVVLYVTVQIFDFEDQPTHAGTLAATFEQSHPQGEPLTHHPL
jgi:hypothetical protein